jgi:hypothetical protein
VADDLKHTADLADRPVVASTPTSRPPDRPALTYMRRFRIVYFALAVVLGAAVGAFILFVGSPLGSSQKDWSDWRPTGHGENRAFQISDFVSAHYKLANGRPLVGVIPGQPSVQLVGAEGPQSMPISGIAVAGRTSDASDATFDLISPDSSMMYILCGLRGTDCAIEGTPSVQRTRIVHREVLELALYTFKYMTDVDRLVFFLPPSVPRTQAAASAASQTDQRVRPIVYFSRADLQPALDRPLPATLPGTRRAGLSQSEERTVERFVLPNLYNRFEVQRAPQGDVLLILQRVGAS